MHKNKHKKQKNAKEKMTVLSNTLILPDDIFQLIMNHMETPDLIVMSMTCKVLNRIAKEICINDVSLL